jgi:hypothetical protein
MKFNAFGSLMLLPSLALAQMSTSPGTNMVLDAGTTLRVNAPVIWQIPAGASVINNGGIVLGPDAELNESAGAAITGEGTERIQLVLAAPTAALDAGGLGGILTTGTAPGPTTFIRGHVPYTDYSGHTSIARWLHVLPSINSGLNATFSLHYDVNELNTVPELSQIMHIRAQDNIWWLLPSNVNTIARTVTSTGLDSLGLFTTFDQDLPNGITEASAPDGFVVGTDPAGTPWLRVPADHPVHQLELFDAAGRLITTSSLLLEPGWHPLSTAATRGLFVLRVNGTTSLPLVCP